MSGCCPLVDGTTPPGPTPPLSSGCENTVLVQASDPFATLPAPIANLINLVPDTLYKFCGRVNIANNILVLPPNSVIAGEDPALDGVVGTAGTVISAAEGGTVKDLAVVLDALAGSAIQIGDTGSNWQDCVIWNVSTTSRGAIGVLVLGAGGFLSIARILDRGSNVAIEIGVPGTPTTVDAANIDNQLFQPPRGVAGIGVQLLPGSTVGALAITESAYSIPSPLGFGFDLRGTIGTLRVASCALQGGGTPSVVAQPGGLPNATVGSAIQGESVGCVGFDNSAQRGSIQIQNALTPIPGPGIPVPVGTPASSYVLDPSSLRVSLDGANAPAQSIRFDRLAPYSAEITVSLSVQVAIGLTFTPRIVVAGIEINGAPTALQFAGTTPDFTSQAPVSISFTTPATLQGGDLVRLLISNQTDAANLDVVAARITIT
jgi:hypothetical protein